MCWCTHLLGISCHTLSVLCCCQNCLLQEVSADRQHSVPTGYLFSADSFISSRWILYTAGGHPSQPMMFCNAHRRFSGTLTSFQKRKCSENRGSSAMAASFRAIWVKHASFAHPEAGAVATFPLHLIY